MHEIRTIDLACELDRLESELQAMGFNSAADANARNSTNRITSNPLPTETEIGYPLSDNVMDSAVKTLKKRCCHAVFFPFRPL